MQIIVEQCKNNTMETFLKPPVDKIAAMNIIRQFLGSENIEELDGIIIKLDGTNHDLEKLEHALKQCGWCKKL